LTRSGLQFHRARVRFDVKGGWNVEPQLPSPRELVTVQLAYLPQTAFQMPFSDDGLLEAERATAAQFTFQDDRVRFKAARQLLRRTLSYQLRIPEQEVPLDYQNGRPFVVISKIHNRKQTTAERIAVSVTHSARVVAVAIGPVDQLGIDVEVDDGKPINIEAIERTVFSNAERHALSESTSRRKRFFSLWVRKEAYLKALGCGLSSRPALRCTIEAQAQHEYFFVERILRSRVYIAVAHKGEGL